MSQPLQPDVPDQPPLPPVVRDVAISVVRDFTGKIVGGLLGAAAAAGITVSAQTSQALTTAVFAVLIVGGQMLYYAAVRWAEQRWPGVGRLLGAARAPSYGAELPVHLRPVVDHELTEAEVLALQRKLQTQLAKPVKVVPR